MSQGLMNGIARMVWGKLLYTHLEADRHLHPCFLFVSASSNHLFKSLMSEWVYVMFPLINKDKSKQKCYNRFIQTNTCLSFCISCTLIGQSVLSLSICSFSLKGFLGKNMIGYTVYPTSFSFLLNH